MDEEKRIQLSEEKAVVSPEAEKATKLNQAVWAIWWIGTGLVVASWFSIVSNTIGWIGFSLGLASTFVSVMFSKYWRVPK